MMQVQVSGDLIMTGTPAGVGTVEITDRDARS